MLPRAGVVKGRLLCSGKLGDAEALPLVANRRLGSCASKRGACAKQVAHVCVHVLRNRIRLREQVRKVDLPGYALVARHGLAVGPYAQRTLPSHVRNAAKVVSLKETARGLALRPRAGTGARTNGRFVAGMRCGLEHFLWFGVARSGSSL